jgi:hypothetical protein
MGTHGMEAWMNILSCAGHSRRQRSPGRALVLVVICQPLTAATSPLEFVVDTAALRQISIRVLRFSPVTLITQTDRTQQLLTLRNHFNWQHS